MSKYEIESDIAHQYSKNTDTYIKLSTGGLGLSVFFVKDILGSPSIKESSSCLLLATWIGLLLTVILGVTYQYLSVRWLESIAGRNNLLFKGVRRSTFWQGLVDRCSVLYLLMMVAFYSAIVFFFIFGIARLSRAT